MTIPGTYILSFYYAKSSSYFPNNLQIYFNGTLIDTIVTLPKNWEFYRNFVYSILGTNTITFQGQDDSNYKDISSCNI